jgi:hypothetical protein
MTQVPHDRLHSLSGGRVGSIDQIPHKEPEEKDGEVREG